MLPTEAGTWRTMSYDEARPAGYWQDLHLWCLCQSDLVNPSNPIVSIDPDSDESRTCKVCGRSYRLVIQVKEPACR